MRKIIDNTDRNEISSNCFVIDELVWDYLSEDPDFISWFDAAPEADITRGYLGSILGLDILTDAHLPPKLQTLQDGECFMTASPYVVGSITHRTNIQCRVFDNCPKDHKGWLFEQNEGMILVGKEAVVRAIIK